MPKGRRNDGDKSKGWGAPKGHPPYNVNGEGGVEKYWTNERIEEVAEYFWEYLDEPSSLYFKKFVIWLRRTKKIKIHLEYLSRWADQNEKFKEVYDYAKLWQECRLLEGGLINKLNPGLVKFMLSAVHGMNEKQVVEHEGKDLIRVVHYGDQEPKTWSEEQEEWP